MRLPGDFFPVKGILASRNFFSGFGLLFGVLAINASDSLFFRDIDDSQPYEKKCTLTDHGHHANRLVLS